MFSLVEADLIPHSTEDSLKVQLLSGIDRQNLVALKTCIFSDTLILLHSLLILF